MMNIVNDEKLNIEKTILHHKEGVDLIPAIDACENKWLKNDCVDSIADIVNVIQRCVKRRKEEI